MNATVLVFLAEVRPSWLLRADRNPWFFWCIFVFTMLFIKVVLFLTISRSPRLDLACSRVQRLVAAAYAPPCYSWPPLASTVTRKPTLEKGGEPDIGKLN